MVEKEKVEGPTEEKAVNGSRKKLVWAILKLVAAIGVLTAAVNNYLDQENKNAELGRQNALILQALGSKVNNLGNEVSYIKGRLDSLPAFRPSHHRLEQPPPVRPVGMAPAPKEDEVEPAGVLGEVEVTSDAPEPERSKEDKAPPLRIDAFEDVPTSLKDLQQMQVDLKEGFRR
jgi:hypothetical protein